MFAYFKNSGLQEYLLSYLSPTDLRARQSRIVGLTLLSKQWEIAWPAIHDATEELHTIFSFSRVCRANQTAWTKRGKPLKEEICRSIHNYMESSDYNASKRLIDTGHYLHALKIYFSSNPQSLKNLDGFQRNALHNSVSPNCDGVHSPLFVKFILEMNRIHRLGLLQMKDCEQQTPYQRAAKARWQKPPQAIMDMLEKEEDVKKEIITEVISEIVEKVCRESANRPMKPVKAEISPPKPSEKEASEKKTSFKAIIPTPTTSLSSRNISTSINFKKIISHFLLFLALLTIIVVGAYFGFQSL